MGDNISEAFLTCLDNLCSEKAMERKSAFENFSKFLADDSLLQILDANSSRNETKGRFYTWNSLLKVVKRFISKEAEKILSKSNGNDATKLSSAMQISRNNCVKLFKTLVKAATQKRSKAKPPNFFHCILSILRKPDLLSLFGQDFSQILVKDVLTSNLLIADMSSDIFLTIFETYKGFYANLPEGWKSIFVLGVHEKLLYLTKNIVLSSNDLDNIFKFLQEVFSNIKEESINHFEGLLEALMEFTRSYVLDCRSSVCALGEKIIPYFLKFWNKGVSLAIQTKFLEFFYLQIVVHNPNGQLEIGSLSRDTKKWHAHLKFMFNVLIKECERGPQKSKLTTNYRRGVCWMPEFASLTVDVCNLVFSMKDDHELGQVLQTFKRPRTIYNIFALLDPLTKLMSTVEIIPWLRVLTGLLAKYPSVFQADELLKLSDTILLIQLATKQAEVRSCLLECNRALISAYVSKNLKIKDFFEKIFVHTVRMVALNQSHEESHGLLQSLLSNKLVRPNGDFHRLFSPGSSNPVTSSSLSTLLIFLENFPIPSYDGNGSISSDASSGLAKRVYQTQILHWIFPSSDDYLTLRFRDDFRLIVNLAKVSVILCCREGYYKMEKNPQEPAIDVSISLESESWLVVYNAIKEELLKSTFDFPLANSSSTDHVLREPSNSSVILEIKNQLLLSVDNETGILFDPNQTFTLDIFAKQACFLIILRKLTVKYRIMTDFCKLDDLIKRILGKIGHDLTPCLKETLGLTSNVIESLLNAVEFESSESDWLWPLFPTSLLDNLLIAISSQENMDITFTTPTTRNNFSPLLSSTQMNNSTVARKELDDLMDVEPATSQATNKITGTKVDESSLPSTIKLYIAKFLVKYSYGTLSRGCYEKQLLASITFDKINVTDQQNVILVLSLAKSLLDQGSKLGDAEIEYIITNVRAVLRRYRTKSEFSADCVSILEQCVKYVVPVQDEIRIRVDNRGLLVKMTNSLWTRQKEEVHQTGFVMALINLTSTMLRYDATAIWCDYDRKEQERLASPFRDLILMLKSPALQIRLRVATKLGQVLTNLAKNRQLSNREKVKKIFDECYTILCENTPCSAHSNSVSPYLSSLLMFLYQTATASLDCEKDCVFALFQVVKIKNVKTDLVSKVLVALGRKLCLSSRMPILQLHFLFIVTNWLDLGYPLEELPFILFQCQTLREFYRKYQSQLVPLVVRRLEKTNLDEIAKELGKETKTLVQDLFPRILTWIVPWFTADENTTANAKKRRTAAKCFSNLNEISDEMVEKQISKVSDKIVSGLLLSLNEKPTQERFKNYERFLPPPNCGNLSSDDIVKSLDFVKNSHPARGSAVEIVSATEGGVPNLLFGIRSELFRAERKEERVRIILVYHLFMDLALPLFATTLKATSPFITREIAQTMLNQLALLEQPLIEIDRCLATLCIYALKYLCSNAVEILANSVSDLVPDIIDGVLIFKDDVLSNEVGDLLNLLVVEKGHFLSKTLALVDELPDEPFLVNVRAKHKRFKKSVQSLDEAVEYFLNGSCRRKNSVRREGLLQLLRELRNRRDEIVKMALFIRNRNSFSEDLEESNLHLTICHLLSFGQSPCPEIRQLAAQCLGEIGPVDLGSPILPTIRCHKKEKSFYASEEYQIYVDLANYASDKRIEVFTAAITALKNLFSTANGAKFHSQCKKNGEGDLSLYFEPLLSRVNLSNVEMEVDFSSVDDGELWCPKTRVSYHSWISRLVRVVLISGAHQSSLFKELEPLCLVEPKFCEKIFPYVISSILERENEIEKEILSRHVSSFVRKHCDSSKETNKLTDSQNTTSSYENSEESIYRDKNALQTILNVIHYLRMRTNRKNETTIWQTNFALKVNYLHMASAASYCGAYFTSLLYLELWCDEMNGIMKTNDDPDFNSQGSSQMTRLSSHDQIDKVQQWLLEAFKGIGDIDGIHGCSRVFGDSFPLRLCLYERENKWDRVLSICDLEMSGENSNLNLGVLKALQRSGLTNTFSGYLRGLAFDASEPSPELAEYQAECSWRASRWNFTLPQTSNVGVHGTLFKALNYLENKDYESSLKELSVGREKVLEGIPRNSLEAVKSVYPFLSHLRALATIESAIRLKDVRVDQLLKEWETVNSIPFGDFELFEPNLSLQAVILGQMSCREGPPCVKGLRNTLWKILKLARDENHLEIAVNASRRLKNQYQDELENCPRLKLEEARVYWKRGETNVAKQVLKSLLKPLGLQVDEKEASGKTPLYAETLIQYGKWQVETSSESTNTILSNYLEKAMAMLKKSSSNKELIDDAHLTIARYSDAQYLSLSKYRNTPEFQRKLKSMMDAKEEAKKLTECPDKTNKEIHKAILIREKQCNIDKIELDSVEENLCKFRDKALKNYLYCLKDTNAHDLRVFRIVSLWFENYQDDNINGLMKGALSILPTYKFLPLIYQLAARMGTQDSKEFDSVLIQLIKRMCQDHPHHTVPVLLALSNANKDSEMTQPQTSKSRKKVSISDVHEKRIVAANEVISFVKKTKMDYVTQIENLADGYVELAYISAKELKQNSKHKLPKGLKLLRNNYDKVPVLTREIPIDYGCKYENMVCVVKFGPEFYTCGGINAPKRIECFGDDGGKHSQLVKGQDDIRQDAVMQEVFTLVNRFLDKNVETRKRKLRIRTYKIVPLSKRSGVLQWCEGTQPFGQYLIGGSQCAHTRYYPREWTAIQCRNHIAQTGNTATKLKLFQKVCENFSPVFRYFFLERFPEPSKWYERRLAYSRSVAANSIVGYILGLGDRHVQNILVDLRTAELINIDFGIAFEQGKILPTPETVPFRLSREIVDGFGICGVEGTFRQCCEKTMEVMRDSQESLLTILEVLLYDPLYMWSISPDKAAYIQRKRANEGRVENGNDSDTSNQGVEVNKLAERTLLRLQQKLQGVEDNVALSVSGQVGLLIQQARDPENLCRIFAGWQPYL